ncbi:MAG TPA: hypothetical protein PLM53_20320 [Spirochaetota bacterium]|nr:hypothetical protein [Spirochaetota bacterium]HQH99441.1 hypothetical protein [Spirochaetota bacterium]
MKKIIFSITMPIVFMLVAYAADMTNVKQSFFQACQYVATVSTVGPLNTGPYQYCRCLVQRFSLNGQYTQAQVEAILEKNDEKFRIACDGM